MNLSQQAPIRWGHKIAFQKNYVICKCSVPMIKLRNGTQAKLENKKVTKLPHILSFLLILQKRDKSWKLS